MRQSDDRKLQLAAAGELLYRGYGPPTEVVESVESSDVESVESSLRELHEIARVARLRMAAALAAEGQPVIQPSCDLQIVSKP